MLKPRVVILLAMTGLLAACSGGGQFMSQCKASMLRQKYTQRQASDICTCSKETFEADPRFAQTGGWRKVDRALAKQSSGEALNPQEEMIIFGVQAVVKTCTPRAQ